MSIEDWIKLLKVVERGGGPKIPYNLHDGIRRTVLAFDGNGIKASAFFEMVKEAEVVDLSKFPIEDDMPKPPGE
jgi:hypothetical protein